MPRPESRRVVPRDDWELHTPEGDAGRTRSKRASSLSSSSRKASSRTKDESWLPHKSSSSFDAAWDRRDSRSTRKSRRSKDAFPVDSPGVRSRSSGASGHTNHAVVSPLPQSRLEPFTKGTPQTEPTMAETQGDVIPDTYVNVISEAFGRGADLYRDVLRVSPHASPRDIRIAYFRRGREVLSENSHALNAPATGTISRTVSNVAKLRFQAVSMAYEIISSPAWLEEYERYGLCEEESDEDDNEDEIGGLSFDAKSAARSVSSTSALRRTSSRYSRHSRTSKSVSGVHWNEEVEELVFDQDPEEFSFKTERDTESSKKDARKKSKKKKKKKKKRIAVEADDLERHLEQLDKEAENHFVDGFLDDLEQSIDQFLNFKGGDESDSPEEPSASSTASTNGDGIRKELFPEEEAVEKRRRKKSSRKKEALEVTPDRKPDRRKDPPSKPRKRPQKSEEIADEDFGPGSCTRMPSRSHAVDGALLDEDPFPAEVPPSDPFTSQDEQLEGAWGLRSDDLHQQESAVHVPRVPQDDNNSFSAPRNEEFYNGEFSPQQAAPRWGDKGVDVSGSEQPKNISTGSDGSLQQQNHSNPAQTGMDPWAGASNTEKFISVSADREKAGNVFVPVTSFPPLPPRPQEAGRQAGPRFTFDGPADIQVSETQAVTDDNASAAYTVDDTVSTLSASVVNREVNRDLTNSRHKQKNMDKVEETYQKINTTIDAIVSPKRTGSNPSAVVDPSKSPSNLSTGELHFFENLCGEELKSSPERGLATGDAETDFSVYFMAYLNALSNDLVHLGHAMSSWGPSGFMDAMTISETDLDGVLGVLEAEMDVVPDDIALMQKAFK